MLVAPEDAITLNVGGQRFGTSRATLRSGGPAFFDALQDRARLDAGTNRDSSQPDAGRGRGEYLIDRDPQHFPAVLNFLRSGRCALPDTTAALLALREEGEAYQVTLMMLSTSNGHGNALQTKSSACCLSDMGGTLGQLQCCNAVTFTLCNCGQFCQALHENTRALGPEPCRCTGWWRASTLRRRCEYTNASPMLRTLRSCCR